MMTEFTVKLADIPVRIRAIHPSMRRFLQDYLCEEEAALTICTREEDLERERVFGEISRREEGLPPVRCTEEYLETLAIYRKLAEWLPERDVVLFHGSVIAVDGQAYLFTAKSGTGKSTHTRLWRELFGDRAVMVNDDKPLLHIGKEGVTAYGTPWNGKHHLGGNLSAPLKALCILQRDKTNHIEPVSAEDAFAMLLQQSYRPETGTGMVKTLELLEKLSKQVKLYRLGCNMEPEAARISYQGMQEEE